MKIIFVISLMLSLCRVASGQLQNTDPDEAEEDRLESLSEASETESEDEYYLQQLAFYKAHPLNINGSESDLDEFPLLEPLQIENLMTYRKLLGDLISVYELQSVPGFTVEAIKKILPYIAIADKHLVPTDFDTRFLAGNRTLVVRPSLVPEKAKGFSDTGAGKYLGGRERMMTRYKYQYRDLLQYGVVADQDAGEKFVFNHGQAGFDFYSVHLFARKFGFVKALALGDYTVNFGQGLIQWQSQAYNKSSSVINIKRQSETLRPYHSAGEYNFFRGIGITLQKNHMETTLFFSRRKLSANTGIDDEYGSVITSVQTSGLHRTASEIEDRNVAVMKAMGGSIKWRYNSGHVGMNAGWYNYSLPLRKRDLPYNLFAVRGKQWAGYSADYSFTYHNYHVFGELALDKNIHRAVIAGLMSSLDPGLDLAILLRSIDPAYQSINGNAFTENTMPSNENGVYLGASLRPAPPWKVDLYADFFKFPWLRYRADAPGLGSEYLLQVMWQPNKKVQVYSRFRARTKPINEVSADRTINYLADKMLRNWRTQIGCQLSKDVLLRNRIEFSWFGDAGQADPETGFLVYTDVLYKPFGKSYSAGARFQVFETGGYDTRLYAYENDVLFSNSSPAFFDKGARIYLNLKARLHFRKLKALQINLGLKAATSLYTGKASIGSGQDEIPENHKSELKVQLVCSSI